MMTLAWGEIYIYRNQIPRQRRIVNNTTMFVAVNKSINVAKHTITCGPALSDLAMPDGFWPPQLNFPPDHSWKPVKPTEQLKLSKTETKKPLKRVKPLKPLNGGRAAHICGDKQRKWKLLIGAHQLSPTCTKTRIQILENLNEHSDHSIFCYLNPKIVWIREIQMTL